MCVGIKETTKFKSETEHQAVIVKYLNTNPSMLDKVDACPVCRGEFRMVCIESSNYKVCDYCELGYLDD